MADDDANVDRPHDGPATGGHDVRPATQDAATTQASWSAHETAGGFDDLDELDDLDVEAIEREERRASRRISSIEAGRRKGGAAGAAMAGAMLAVSEIYEGPPKEDAPIEIEASGEPGDIDTDGIEFSVGEFDVWAPPPHER